MNANYFFIDGSALSAEIRVIRRVDPKFESRKLCPILLLRYFMRNLSDLHGNSYKRATFYFPTDDEVNVAKHVAIPDHSNPGEIRDLHFKYCGQKLKRTKDFNEFVETQVPDKFRNHFSKSEKGIDIEMCCDAFKLASSARLDRLFLLTNDEDFVPFCRAIKEFGANISIIHLWDDKRRNISLLREADSYDVVADSQLHEVFLPKGDPFAPAKPFSESDSNQKPDAEPSDRNRSHPPFARP